MSLMVAAFAAVLRMIRPARGLHVRPYVLRDERPAPRPAVAAPPPAARPARVRPYAAHAAPVSDWTPLPADGPDSPAMVRPFVAAAERRRDAERAARADATRLGVGVLMDIAATAGAGAAR